jgi:hypothetical protein
MGEELSATGKDGWRGERWVTVHVFLYSCKYVVKINS